MSTDQSEHQQIDFPKLNSPALRALTAAGYTQLEQLANVSADELLQLHGMGPKALGVLRAALSERGWSLVDESS